MHGAKTSNTSRIIIQFSEHEFPENTVFFQDCINFRAPHSRSESLHIFFLIYQRCI